MALVLGGGANNGAWEAGVLYGLLRYGNKSDYEYDLVSGISVGSINAFAVAVRPKGQEVEMTEWLTDTWKNMKTSDIW